MGELIRILILAICIWLVWRWLTHRNTSTASSAASASAAAPAATATDKLMVRCAVCALNLPSDDAFHHKGKHFCCQQHQSDYLQQQARQEPS